MYAPPNPLESRTENETPVPSKPMSFVSLGMTRTLVLNSSLRGLQAKGGLSDVIVERAHRITAAPSKRGAASLSLEYART